MPLTLRGWLMNFKCGLKWGSQLSLAISSYIQLSIAISRYLKLSPAISSYIQLYPAIFRYLQLTLAISSYGQLSLFQFSNYLPSYQSFLTYNDFKPFRLASKIMTFQVLSFQFWECNDRRDFPSKDDNPHIIIPEIQTIQYFDSLNLNYRVSPKMVIWKVFRGKF